MRIFIDTSAFFALLDKDDVFHMQATKTWKRILEEDKILVTSNYVLLECFALIQNRLYL